MTSEPILVDVTTPYRKLIHITAEAICFAALFFGLMGVHDRGLFEFPPQVRQALPLVFLMVFFFRFVVPIARARRRRFVVTPSRISVRAGGFFTKAEEIPMRAVVGIERQRSTVIVTVEGGRRLFFKEVPRAAGVVAVVNEILAARVGHYS